MSSLSLPVSWPEPRLVPVILALVRPALAERAVSRERHRTDPENAGVVKGNMASEAPPSEWEQGLILAGWVNGRRRRIHLPMATELLLPSRGKRKERISPKYGGMNRARFPASRSPELRQRATPSMGKTASLVQCVGNSSRRSALAAHLNYFQEATPLLSQSLSRPTDQATTPMVRRLPVPRSLTWLL